MYRDTSIDLWLRAYQSHHMILGMVVLYLAHSQTRRSLSTRVGTALADLPK